MSTRARVSEWHDEEGWGVVESAATPGGCWVHVSSVLVAGLETLDPGTEVELTFEAGGQDGYGYRAVEVWPVGATPVRTADAARGGPSGAYSSTLRLTFDDDPR